MTQLVEFMPQFSLYMSFFYLFISWEIGYKYHVAEYDITSALVVLSHNMIFCHWTLYNHFLTVRNRSENMIHGKKTGA